jgi:hypothetical protein
MAIGREVDDAPAHASRSKVAGDPGGSVAARTIAIEHD